MLISVEIKENEILKAAEEMIVAAEELSQKAWKLKTALGGQEKTPPDEMGGE